MARRGAYGLAWMALVSIASRIGASARAQTPQSASAQPEQLPPYRARLLGIYDAGSGAPVEGVRVLDLATGMSSLTSATGTVSLVFVPDGGGLIRLQKLGYLATTMRVAIGPSDLTPLTVVIERLTELPGVVTTGASPSKYLSPALRGFEERRRSHVSGVFIGDSIIRRDESRQLADLLRTHANVQIAERQGGSEYLMKSPRCSNGGPPQVYLDGVPLSAPPDPKAPVQRKSGVFGAATLPQPILPFDLSAYHLSDITGIEYYPDNAVMPAEFSHTSDRCGALMLWTRER
jgi:hypothetical protein